MIILNPNDVVDGYTVECFIKKGIYNTTYRVSDKDGDSYFMKLYDLEATPESMKENGEVREIAYSRKVNNEYVISHHADGRVTLSDEREYSYIVTRFFRGKLLSEDLASYYTYTWEEAKDIMTCVLKGLVYIHDALGMTHNDITPRNILLEEVSAGSYVPRIIDLGHLSQPFSGAVPFPVEDLALQYCAPETLSGCFDETSDSFSAMAIMYHMITGVAPWDAELTAGMPYPAKKRAVRAARKQPLEVRELERKGLAKRDIDLITEGLAFDSRARLTVSDLLKFLTGESAPQFSRKDGDDHKSKPQEGTHESAVATTVQIKKKSGGGFADVAGMETLKEELTKRVIWVLKDKEKAQKYRLTPPNGMILYGPPGCGKTYFAEKFAEEAQFNFSMVSGSDLGSTYLHGTQGKIASLFKDAEAKAPSILCFDEFDSFVPARGSMDANQRGEEVNEFLAQLNNCSQRGIFVIGTTNRIELIDPAVLRKGRMDLHIEIPAPDPETRKAIFALHLKDRPLDENIDYDELVRLTDNYSASDLAFIVNEAAMTAALADELIGHSHLLNSVKSNKSSLGSPQQARRKIGY